MVQRVEQSGQSSGRTKKLPQSSEKPKKAAKKTGATDTTLRTPEAPTPSEAIHVVTSVVSRLSPDERRGLIAEAAYLRAERRGFVNGGEMDDWLAAEAEIDAKFSK
jgi:hypothetical protein